MLSRFWKRRPAVTENANPTSVGMINVPADVGPNAWTECFEIMSNHADVFGINEAINRPQKELYSQLAHDANYGAAGLWSSPNPIFYDRAIFNRLDQRTVTLHGRGPRYSEYPGFNDARFANVVLLQNRKTKVQATYINVHLAAYNPYKVPGDWVADKHRESLEIIEMLVDKSLNDGDVSLFGDFNIGDPIKFPKFKGVKTDWVKKVGIDKIVRFSNSPKYQLKTFKAPTDHRRGYVAKPIKE